MCLYLGASLLSVVGAAYHLLRVRGILTRSILVSPILSMCDVDGLMPGIVRQTKPSGAFEGTIIDKIRGVRRRELTQVSQVR